MRSRGVCGIDKSYRPAHKALLLTCSTTSVPTYKAESDNVCCMARRHMMLGFLQLSVWPIYSHASEVNSLTWLQLKAGIRKQYPNVAQVTVPELIAWLKDSQRIAPLLVDARSQDEFLDGHLVGALSAQTLAQVKTALQYVPNDRPVVLYCSVGKRSSKLAQELLATGRQHVFNLEGSVFEWANAGHPLISQGRSTHKTHPYDTEWGRYLDRKHWSREP